MELADITGKMSAFCIHHTERRIVMDTEAVKKHLMEVLSKKLGDGFHISIQKVLKTNTELDGVIIKRQDDPVAATIYLEPFYKGLKNGITLEEATEMVLQAYHCSQSCEVKVDVKSLMDFSNARDRLYVQLINRHFNQKLLADVPHSLFLDDFAVVVRCMVDLGLEDGSSFLVHNHQMKKWNVDQESLLALAVQNTRSRFGVELSNLNHMLLETFPAELLKNIPFSPLWILTNNRRESGASAVLFNGVLEEFAEEHGDFYVIFSSLQEVLLIPAPDGSKLEELTRMNLEVNAAHVAAGEILGTKAYFYKKGVGFVM